MEGEFETVGLLAEGGEVEEEDAARLGDEAAETGGGGDLEGLLADDRDVEAEVLVGLGDFDDEAAAATERAAALDRFVGAFEGFDGEDGAVFHDDGLADVEAGRFFGDAEAEGGVGEFAALEFGTGEVAGGGERIFEKGGRGEEGDTCLREQVGDGSEEGLGVAFLELRENEEGADVGAEIEEIFWRDLPGHDGVGGTGFLRGVGELAELADAEPDQLIGVGGGGGRRLVLESRDGEVSDPGGAGGAGGELGVAPAAGDEEELGGRFARDW